MMSEKHAYDEYYKGREIDFKSAKNINEYCELYERTWLSPFYIGGYPFGHVQRKVTKLLDRRASQLNKCKNKITILNIGCGTGTLSVYLAAKGYNVIGVDCSSEGIKLAQKLAEKFEVINKCIFLAESAESMSIDDSFVDFIIGFGVLHHIIKHNGVQNEFLRIMKKGAEAYFAEPFGENKAYHLFHNKELMEKYGDVVLTRTLIFQNYNKFEVQLIPMSWLQMLDKLYLRIFPKNFRWLIKILSRLHFEVDSRIPVSSRIALYLSGTVMIVIKNKKNEHMYI